MEVRLDKQYPLAVTVEQAWAVLSDVRATAACMPGAQITDQIDDTHYKGTVKSRVGPAVMTFGGDIEVLGLDVSTHTLQLLGKGADKSGSSASMNLTARVVDGDAPGTSVLTGQATIVVSGKLSQFGSRLLVPVSDMMLGQFADNFRAAAAAATESAAAGSGEGPDAPATTVPGPAPADAAIAPPAADPVVASAPTGAARAPAATAATSAPSAPPRRAAPPPPASAPAPANEINALALLWGLVKRWFAGLFGRRSDR